MDTALGHSFEAVLGADNHARKLAEAYLKGLTAEPGLITALLNLTKNSANPHVQLSAVLFLKNCMAKWDQFPVDERELLKSTILSRLVYSEPEKLRLQFCEIAKKLWVHEAPWHSLHPHLAAVLTSNDADGVYAGLTMLQNMTKIYEHKTNDEKRLEVNELAKLYFTPLLELFRQCLGKLQESSFSYLILILQSYYSACYLEIPPFLADAGTLRSWQELFHQLLNIDLGTLEILPANSEERRAKDEHPAWQCKRWAIQTVNRLFSRYRLTAYLDDDAKAISQFFTSQFSQTYLTLFLQQLSETQTKHRPTLYTNFLLKYVTNSIKQPETHTIIAPHVEALLVHVLLPVMSRTPEDEEIWTDDPSEFLRREFDIAKSYYAAKGSAFDMMVAMSEAGHLDLIVGVLGRLLIGATSPLQIEVVLNAIQAISEPILKREDLQAQLPAMFASHVVPMMDSQVPFLRFRACAFLRAFTGCKLSSDLASVITLKIARLMQDVELPVRVEAATTLARLVDWPCAEEILKPELKAVMIMYLTLMNTIDLEDLVDALEALVNKFSSHISPFAIELADSLKQQFFRMVSANPNETHGESAIAAASVLTTLIKIVDSLEADQLPAAVEVVGPVLAHILSKDGCEYIEEGLSLLNTILSNAIPESIPALHPHYALLLQSITSTETSRPYASEHVMATYTPLANFMRKCSSYVQTQIENTVLVTQNLWTFKNSALAMKLHVSLMLNYPTSMGDYLKPMVAGALGALTAASSLMTRNISSMVVCAALYTNPHPTILEVTPHLAAYIAHVTGRDMEKLQDLDSLKLACLGMASWIKAKGPATEVFSRRLASLLQQMDEEGQEAEEGEELTEEAFRKILDNIRENTEEEGGDFPADIFDDELYESPLDDIDVLNEVHAMLSHPAIATDVQAALTPEQFDAVRRILSNR